METCWKFIIFNQVFNSFNASRLGENVRFSPLPNLV
nr:MAG TPA: hypothetical protein [Inoviridae sp.]